MSNKDKFPIENAEVRSSEAGTTFGYAVEARYNYHEPKKFCEKLFDNRWREIPIVESAGGVPTPRYESGLIVSGLHTYEQAQALRWWFLSVAALDGGFCWETRLVKHKVEYRFAATPVEYIEPMDRLGDVPEDMAAIREGGKDA